MSVRYHDVARFDVEEMVFAHVALQTYDHELDAERLTWRLGRYCCRYFSVAPIYRMEWRTIAVAAVPAITFGHFRRVKSRTSGSLDGNIASQSRDSRRRLSGLLAGTLSTYLTAKAFRVPCPCQ